LDSHREAAFKRAKFGAVLLVTAVKIPMLWMGEEFGHSTRETPNHPNKLQWSLLKNQRNHELLAYYKHVILLREKVPALYTKNIEFFPENAETKVLAYYRWSDEGMRAVVVANFGDTYLSGNSIPNFPAETWRELMYNKILEVGEEGFKFVLPELSAQVFVLAPENLCLQADERRSCTTVNCIKDWRTKLNKPGFSTGADGWNDSFL